MYEAFTRVVTALRTALAPLVPALQMMAAATGTRPWWTTAPQSVQFARVQQLGRMHPTRGPTLRCRIHRRRS